jgi:hypothetical protein
MFICIFTLPVIKVNVHNFHQGGEDEPWEETMKTLLTIS